MFLPSRTLLAHLTCSGLLCLPLAASSRPVSQDEKLPDLKGEIDLSIRWLRSKQDPATGAYGDSLATTALVLRALARSPRRYVRRDGPLVARALDHLLAHQSPQGWIAEPQATDAERLDETRAAARALFLFVDAETTPALARSVAWLGRQGVADPAADDAPRTPPRAEAHARAVQLLATRREDGSWDGQGGRVQATARAVLELSALHPVLRKKSDLPRGAEPLPALRVVDRAQVDAAVLRGARFLIAAADDGRWGAPGQPDAGITAMVLGALQAVPRPRPADVQQVIDSGLEWIAGLQREDGSIHQGRLANYVTSACVLALARSGREAYRPILDRARAFLVELQADEGEGYSADHPFYGGIGYGGDERPDLSNLQMALEALVASGLDEDHQAFRRAVSFLERCQNRSESSDLEVLGPEGVIVAGNDGGASYYPGDSKAGFEVLEDGRRIPRSYGSMTYALLKGYVFAGLDKEDPRVKACWDWLQEHYTLDVNPGFEHSADPTAAYQGLFYYFHSMSRALAVFGTEVVVDSDGRAHHWRAELAGRLIAMQSKLDGSWVNQNAARWYEGNPVLATSYALLTLAETRGVQ